MNNYVKDFDNWNKEKKLLNDRKKFFYFKERQIWWCSFGVNVGYEIDGKHEQFERPALVIKRLGKYNAIVVPLTSTNKESKNFISYEFQGEIKSANISQVRMIDARRFQRKLGMMPEEKFQEIKNKLIELIK
ncbi:type II toxin-antitoxin system PemK/MazF family toxin [Lactovum odontotermitis]